MNVDIEALRERKIEVLNQKKERLVTLKAKLEEAVKNNEERKIEVYSQQINDVLSIINNQESEVNNLREPSLADIQERVELFKGYADKVNAAVPDNIPLVFHGNSNIGTVEEIIRGGGLKTPDERGVSMKSFATQIDVTYKKDIHVSLEFADSGLTYVQPYGAIFAFFPKEEEVDNVLSTLGSEVAGGVQSIDFVNEADRLFAIITTNENLQRLKQVAMESGVDPSKVCTHEQFLNMCLEKFDQVKLGG